MDDIKNYTLKLEYNAQIISLLSNNTDALNKVSRFQLAVEKLKSKLNKTEDLHSLLIKDITTIEKDKNEKRIELGKSLIPVIRIMQVFAYDKKKKKMQQQLEYLTLDYIQKCTDFELIKISKKIWKTANKHGGYSLAFESKKKSPLNSDYLKKINKFEKEYGLNPVMIKNIEETNLKFVESLIIYQKEIKEKGKVAYKMKNILKQTDDIFTNKIDQFVTMSESISPELFKDYFDLREKNAIKKLNKENIQQNTIVEKTQIKQAKKPAKPITPRKIASSKEESE